MTRPSRLDELMRQAEGAADEWSDESVRTFHTRKVTASEVNLVYPSRSGPIRMRVGMKFPAGAGRLVCVVAADGSKSFITQEAYERERLRGPSDDELAGWPAPMTDSAPLEFGPGRVFTVDGLPYRGVDYGYDAPEPNDDRWPLPVRAAFWSAALAFGVLVIGGLVWVMS